jgi:hypothetical protein
MTNQSKQSNDQARLTLTVRDGVVDLKLRIRARWLLALLLAAATVTGSPALMDTLSRLAG